MKKALIVLSFLGIAFLTLNSCSSTKKCKGGSCPIWSSSDTPEPIPLKDLKFINEIVYDDFSWAHNNIL